MGLNENKKRNVFRSICLLSLIALLFSLLGCSGFINRGILPTQVSTDQQLFSPFPESSELKQAAVRDEKEDPFALIPEKDLNLVERDLREWAELDYFLRDFDRWAFPSEEEPTLEMELVLNGEVDRYLRYFMSDASAYFSRALSRSGRYLPMMKEIFRNNGIPEELVYMALIESGFLTNAVSPAKAVGPWQFIRSTGRHYGLVINEWIDERRDPVKSTYAASLYLKDLYNLFGSWELAKAGYNAGEFSILRAIEKAKTKDFWQLSKRGYLKRETREYVPKFMAAAIIAKNPEKYGFKTIAYDEPLLYDEVNVKGSLDLRSVAKATGTPYEKIKELNPELKRSVIPSNHSQYKLKLPYGTKKRFLANIQPVRVRKTTASVAIMNALKRGEPLNSIASKYGLLEDGKGSLKYRIKPGDSLSKIAETYGLTVRAISEANAINNASYIVAGQTIIIPFMDTLLAGNGADFQKQASSFNSDKNNLKRESIVHEVKRGDTLWNIAQAYNVEHDKIAEWNSIGSSQYIRPGDKLRIFILNE